MTEEMRRAMWEGDHDKLSALAGCICCCADHTFAQCPARIWYGCRGGGPNDLPPHDLAEEYRAFYGMTQTEFYGLEGV